MYVKQNLHTLGTFHSADCYIDSQQSIPYFD